MNDKIFAPYKEKKDYNCPCCGAGLPKVEMVQIAERDPHGRWTGRYFVMKKTVTDGVLK